MPVLSWRCLFQPESSTCRQSEEVKALIDQQEQTCSADGCSAETKEWGLCKDKSKNKSSGCRTYGHCGKLPHTPDSLHVKMLE